jgi:hypothetical protein
MEETSFKALEQRQHSKHWLANQHRSPDHQQVN